MLEKNKEGHNPLAIANRFVEKGVLAGRPLDILQLVKFVYLAHGWCLGETGKPLISTKAQAWRHGPVIPEVYYEFRPQGIHNIAKLAVDKDGSPLEAELSQKEKEVVDRVYENYIGVPGGRLSELTHAEGTPWAQTRGYYAPIPDHIIRDYYEKWVKRGQEVQHD